MNELLHCYHKHVIELGSSLNIQILEPNFPGWGSSSGTFFLVTCCLISLGQVLQVYMRANDTNRLIGPSKDVNKDCIRVCDSFLRVTTCTNSSPVRFGHVSGHRQGREQERGAISGSHAGHRADSMCPLVNISVAFFFRIDTF